jgi:hypothetical protein
VINRLIAAAARDVLGPLGFRRKGRSRLWFADYGWWLILVEFQPSGWSRGAYLNVAAKWLWSPFASWSFDFAFHPAARVGGFIEFQNEDQFRTASRELATAAAAEAVRLREALPDIAAVADRLAHEASDDGDGWNAYHAGVSAFLAGRTDEAQQYFRRLSVTRPDDHPDADWIRELRATAGEFATVTVERDRFRAILSEQVNRSRISLRLPETNVELPDVSFDAA